MKKNAMTIKKSNGRIYTPDYIVKNILDLSNYCGDKILKKHVIDNSCGDGAFLKEIVKRYCEVSKNKHIDFSITKKELQTYIHGIEKDKIERDKCVENLEKISNEYGLFNVKWDIVCGDALKENRYNGKMDFVLGNPPYIRVHNLGGNFSEVKQYSFAQEGMTDLFIVFYEIGLKMLNDTGILGYITPSSFYSSVAGKFMRREFVRKNLLSKIVNLRHFQAFNATTYTTIVILDKNKAETNVEYYQYNEKKLIPYYVETLSTEDFYILDNYYFSTKKELDILKKIFFNIQKTDIVVKNGYATLSDSVFIKDFCFKSKYIKTAIKASTGRVNKIIYPYDDKANLVSEEELSSEKELYKYLLSHKKILNKRSREKKDEKFWYSFGRSQALSDTYKDKLSINTLLRTDKDWKISIASKGVGVYSGLYICSNSIKYERIEKTLRSKEFISYIKLLGKYKSGGYYTFSSKDVKAYLDFKFTYNGRGVFMVSNDKFLKVLKDSFKVYLETSARSNKKLEILHGTIAKDLSERLGGSYQIKALGYGNGKEAKISGRYVDKAVDISIFKNDKALGGVAVKYIMSNYSQNSNNYFEGMLGETANLRTGNKAYFQIVVLPKHVPYFKKDGTISKIETITAHNIEKYIKLSQDDASIYMHTPTKTLFYLVNMPKISLENIKDKTDYVDYLLGLDNFEITLCNDKYAFQDSIIYNDYETFINKVVNYINFLE